MAALARLFASGFLLSLSLCLDLGVVNVALVRAGLTRGTSAALLLGLGSCVGDLVYALSSLSLVTLLIAHRQIRIALWLGGSAVLVWLAFKMLKESRASKPLSNAEPERAREPELAAGAGEPGAAVTAGAAAGAAVTSGVAAGAPAGAADFARGVVLALSSPSAILWFAAIGGSVIAAHAHDRAALLPFLTGFFVAGVCWSVLMAALSGYAHRRLSSGFVRALALASALLFAYFAIVVFVNGYREFVLAAT
jgi:L-lysine exporter family protein LysE/ArgO